MRNGQKSLIGKPEPLGTITRICEDNIMIELEEVW